MKHFGSTSGLTALVEDQATPANGMVAYVASSYNSGYQNGDIKGAFLADTDDTDLVGSGELVTNGTFDTDVSGWSANGTSSGDDVTFSWSSGAMSITRGVGAIDGYPYQAITTVAGQRYKASITVSGLGGVLYIRNNLGGGVIVSDASISNQTETLEFVAQGATTYLEIWCTGGQTVTVDNISVKLADADRSVNG